MCKIVYLTSKRFCRPAKEFRKALADELRKRNVQVVENYSYDILNWLRKHKTYGIALAFDFYQDAESGCGLTLNKGCSNIGRDFAYNLSNGIDEITPEIIWRDIKFVSSDDKEWFKFFNKVSSTTKAIFYLCTINNAVDYDVYETAKYDMVKVFADEIIRCLRSNYNLVNYRRSVKAAKIKKNINKEK